MDRENWTPMQVMVQDFYDSALAAQRTRSAATAPTARKPMPNPREILRMIREDAKRDAETLDGKAFDGRTVAVQFGRTLAMVAALARIMEEHVNLHEVGHNLPAERPKE
jgi:hypothetical protein